jgi:hypothetical protein
MPAHQSERIRALHVYTLALDRLRLILADVTVPAKRY